MSGIYIPGMEMPKMCQECFFDVCAICELANEERKLVEIGKRRSDCPLIHVPPHGRLIDEKNIVPKDGYIIADGMACIPVKDIVNAPTVIPASEEGE